LPDSEAIINRRLINSAAFAGAAVSIGRGAAASDIGDTYNGTDRVHGENDPKCPNTASIGSRVWTSERDNVARKRLLLHIE
jgi:hypothetical protein